MSASSLHNLSKGRLNTWLFPWLLGGLLSLLPLWLTLDFRKMYAGDWANHFWMMEYAARYWQAHGSPPLVIHTNEVVGFSGPIFYAGKFQALLGLLATVIGTGLAFRLLAAVSMLVQFIQVVRAADSLGLDYRLGFIIGLLVNWGIYPLTNLYNRGALTEFIAILWLTSATATLVILVFRSLLSQSSWFDAVSLGFCYTCAALTHPLTAVFGFLFLLPLSLLALSLTRNRWLLKIFLANAVVAGSVLSVWIYGLACFGSSLAVSNAEHNRDSFRRDEMFSRSVDTVWTRLSPIPSDPRVQGTIRNVIDPYLDAQISLPLLVFLVGAVILCCRRRTSPDVIATFLFLLGVTAIGLAALAFIVSVCPSLSGWFFGAFDILQFPYRLVSYVNLNLLVALLAFLGLAKHQSQRSLSGDRFVHLIAAGIAVTIGAGALVLKLTHANATRFHVGPQVSRTTDLPPSFYWQFDYDVVRGLRGCDAGENLTAAKLPIGTGSDMGNVYPISLSLSIPQIVQTNILPFPWNQLLIDGVVVSPSDLLVCRSKQFPLCMHEEFLAVRVNPGLHRLEYLFQPDPIWVGLNSVSWLIFLLWLTCCGWFPARASLSRIQNWIKNRESLR
jgi:hypothetical protein